jgi:excisionase family DNA binding protein
MEDYLTTAQVASQKGVTVQTVRRWCEAKKIKATSIGQGQHKVWLIDPESVENVEKDTRGRKSQ